MASNGCLKSFKKFLESSPAEGFKELQLQLSRKRILDRATKDKLESLDGDLEHGIKVRYVFQIVKERAERDQKICDKIHQFLQRQGFHDTVQNEGNKSGFNEVLLTENDIPLLIKILTPGSYKWEEIGIAVGLPKHIREDCRQGSSNVVRLGNVLTAWIMGGHTKSRHAMLKSLIDILLTNVVGLAQLAQSLNKHFADSSDQLSQQLLMDAAIEILEDPLDTEVSEGKSTLLEVQVYSALPVNYQWLKNSKKIEESGSYLGTSSAILFIGQCSQQSQGSYTCIIKSDSVELRSEAAEVVVKMSLEKEHLIKCYSKIHPQDAWPPISNTAYHSLLLHEKAKYSEDKCVPVIGNMEQTFVRKKEMAYREAFGIFSESSLIVVEGRPGSGKTTLVRNLIRDWAIGENILVGSKLVLFVPLRMAQSDTSLEDCLGVLYSEVSMRRKLVDDIERSNGRDMCFVLDGWDEYQYKYHNSIISQLVSKVYLASSMVIVTSRPVAVTSELKRLSNTRIEVIGFTQDRILEYVQTYPFQEICSEWKDMASKLITYLRGHVNVFHMCYLPLHASIICYLYAKNEGNVPCTETKVYEAFTIATLLRKLKRDNKHYVHIMSLMDLEGDDRIHFFSNLQISF